MSAHIACRPATYDDRGQEGCFLVCAEHGIRYGFGFQHEVARAACVEHNALHHADLRQDRPQLRSVVYESVAAPGVGEGELAAIVAASRARNRAVGVTGMLLTEGDRFLQAIEGPAPVVARLMDSIRADTRHRHVRVLVDDVVERRRFPDWAMAVGSISDLEAMPVAQYYEGLLTARCSHDRPQDAFVRVA